MSHMKGLDEHTTADLRSELEERATAQANGRCDYCGRQLHTEPPCRFPDRHNGSKI
jgi:hypothetical protein